MINILKNDKKAKSLYEQILYYIFEPQKIVTLL